MSEASVDIPLYLRETYSWAYLTPWLAKILDRDWVVQSILWGNAQKLIDAALAEVRPGDRTLQPAAVYGDFSCQLAAKSGHLTVRDVAPLQLSHTRRKLPAKAPVRLQRHDATQLSDDRFDAVVCFFLLHEVPDAEKRQIVQTLLRQLASGGRAVFVDYHEPHRLHPLGPLMRLIYRLFEPFATGMWRAEIREMAGDVAQQYRWSKSVRFGGLYQIVVAEAN